MNYFHDLAISYLLIKSSRTISPEEATGSPYRTCPRKNQKWKGVHNFCGPKTFSEYAPGAEFCFAPTASFWSWPISFIGTIDEALSKIEHIEKNTRWTEKIDKAVWRGTDGSIQFGNKDLRPSLILKGKEKEWADIEALKWNTNGESAENAIGIEDFCKYKYIVYTEGITYSGRLLFHQACASIILTPPPTYLLHNTHFMRPIFLNLILCGT
ncbi:hypothetical protein DID88_002632 [Monilinia fructigena]|uniref:Glycosyl transferase CAP10 domain-containing protein n=1 Tax=Monilinia fructigena TaxID=38457 RepID=A0A395IRC0_9HELO|nr:hypothetical protein DID88_002632 [Monilinia fructigena]